MISIETQIADDLDALDGVDVRMEIAHPDPGLVQIFGQILGHALGQRGDQHALALVGAGPAFGEQVVDLAVHRAHVADRIDQPRGPDHLLDEDAAGALQFPVAGGRRDEHGLAPHDVPLLELQRPVVDAGGQPEAVLGQGRLAAEVAAEHAAELGHGDVALVDDDQGLLGQVFDEGRRRFAGVAAG
jgi:hypothetical protein